MRGRIVRVSLSALMFLALMASMAWADGHRQTVTLRVEGMVCPLCEKTVEAVLQSLEGVLEVRADRRAQSAWVVYDPARVIPAQMVQTLNSQTYYRAEVSAASVSQDRLWTKSASSRSVATAVIRVEGMTDNRTASRVTQALPQEGILDGSIDLQRSTLTLQYDPNRVSADEIVKTLTQNLPFTINLISVQRPSSGISPLAIGVGLAIVFVVVAWPVLRRILPAMPIR